MPSTATGLIGMTRHRLVPLVQGATLVAMGISIAIVFAGRFPTEYDGGIAASAGTFIHHGLVPYRDFWILYGPLSGAIVALALVFLPPSVALLQVLGAASMLSQIVAGFLVARRFSRPAVAFTLALAGPTMLAFANGLEVSAWGLALSVAYWPIVIAASTRSSPWLVLAGALAGIAFLSRLEVGVYLLVALLLPTRSRALLAGFAAVAIPAILVSVTLVPLADLIEQLIWYPLIAQREYRNIPFPGPGITPEGAALYSVTLVVVPRLVIVAALVRIFRGRQPDVGFTMMTLFAALVQAQTLSRGDINHFAQASGPALLLLGGVLPRVNAPFGLRASSGLVAGVAGPYFIGLLTALSVGGPTTRDRGLVDVSQRAAALVAPDDRIYVGLTANSYTFINPLLIYYLADRSPGSKYTMYNPGVTNRDDVQDAIIDSLGTTDTNVLVLDTAFATYCEKDNRSCELGARSLDNYIRQNFTRTYRQATYELWVRNSSMSTNAPCCQRPRVVTP